MVYKNYLRLILLSSFAFAMATPLFSVSASVPLIPGGAVEECLERRHGDMMCTVSYKKGQPILSYGDPASVFKTPSRELLVGTQESGSRGKIMRVSKDNPGWYYVNFESGADGWVPIIFLIKDDSKKVKVNTARSSAISTQPPYSKVTILGSGFKKDALVVVQGPQPCGGPDMNCINWEGPLGPVYVTPDYVSPNGRKIEFKWSYVSSSADQRIMGVFNQSKEQFSNTVFIKPETLVDDPVYPIDPTPGLVITRVTPSNVDLRKSNKVTLYGTGFTQNSRIGVEGSSVTSIKPVRVSLAMNIVFQDSSVTSIKPDRVSSDGTRIDFQLPVDADYKDVITILVYNDNGTSGVRVSNSVRITFATNNQPAPIITRATPTTVNLKKDNKVTLFGSGFVPAAYVQMEGPNGDEPLFPTAISTDGKRLEFELPVDGSYKNSVLIRVTDPDGRRSEPVRLTLTNDNQSAPTITRVTPATVYLNQDNLIFVHGTGFTPDSYIQIGGSNVERLYQTNPADGSVINSDRKIAFELPVNGAYKDVISIQVVNANGKTSKEVKLKIGSEKQIITRVSPTTVDLNRSNKVTLYGSGFTLFSYIKVRGSDIDYPIYPTNIGGMTSGGTGREIEFELPVDASYKDVVSIVVFDQSGRSSNEVKVRIGSENRVPTITRISPATVDLGQSNKVTLYGSGFTQKSIILVEELTVPTLLPTWVKSDGTMMEFEIPVYAGYRSQTRLHVSNDNGVNGWSDSNWINLTIR